MTRWALVGVLMTSGGAWAAEGFYADLLEEGQTSFESGDYEAAARELRLASFGLLDEPAVLAGALVRLALAQQAVADSEEVGEDAGVVWSRWRSGSAATEPPISIRSYGRNSESSSTSWTCPRQRRFVESHRPDKSP